MKYLFTTLLLPAFAASLAAIEPGSQSGFWLETSGYAGTHLTDLSHNFEDAGHLNVIGINIYIGYIISSNNSDDYQAVFANIGIANGDFSGLSTFDNDSLDARYYNYTLGYRIGGPFIDSFGGFFQTSIGMSELKLQGFPNEELTGRGFIWEIDFGLKYEFNDHLYMTAGVGAGVDLLDMYESGILVDKQLYIMPTEEKGDF